jgi:hypothetical protein
MNQGKEKYKGGRLSPPQADLIDLRHSLKTSAYPDLQMIRGGLLTTPVLNLTYFISTILPTVLRLSADRR